MQELPAPHLLGLQQRLVHHVVDERERARGGHGGERHADDAVNGARLVVLVSKGQALPRRQGARTMNALPVSYTTSPKVCLGTVALPSVNVSTDW